MLMKYIHPNFMLRRLSAVFLLLLLGALLLTACTNPRVPPAPGTGTTAGTTPDGSDPSTEPSSGSSTNATTPNDPSGDDSDPVDPTDTSASSDDPETVPPTPPVITLPPDEQDSDPAESTGETLPYDPENHPGDSAAYAGVHIASVYGTGKKGAEALIPHGYVQLYNATDKAISLSGASLYYKTDDANPYAQFVFPAEASIPAKGYYLVRAGAPSGFVESNAIFTVENFDAEWDVCIDNKEVRLLLAPSGWLIGKEENIAAFDDAVSLFIASETFNSSVYAVTDLSRNKIAVRTAMTDYSGYHLVNLTRAATADLNKLATRTSSGKVNSVVGSRIREILFSHDAGVYEKSFSLTLSAPEGYTIYYTTDGSDPSKPGNTGRHIYNATGKGITMTDTSAMSWGPMTRAWRIPSVSTQIGAHVVKAFATNGVDSTAVFTNTYFITDDLAAYGVTVMSFSIPKDEMLGSKGFYENYLSGGSITATRPRGVGILEVFDVNGNRVGNSRVEVSVSGNGSSGAGMKSLRVYYKGINNQDAGLQSDLNYDLFGGYAKDADGEAITSFSRLLLRNSGNDCGSSYIRDAYMQRVSAGLHVDTMATASTLLFVNGEFWGVYNARERYSPEYVESHYGVQKENVTLIESDYSQVHTNTNAPFVLSSGEEGDQKPFNDMVQYMRTHNLADQEHYDYICSLMDIDSFIDMWVIRIYFNAVDWPENNIKVWRNKNPNDPSGFDTKWHFTLLDLDMGLSFYSHTTETGNLFGAFNSNSVTGTIMRSLMSNEDFKNRFILRFYEVVMDHMTVEHLSAELEKMLAERDPLMPLQVGRWSSDGASIATWNGDCSEMRSFVANRKTYVIPQFCSHFGVSESDIENMSQRRISVTFHSGRTDVTVNGNAVVTGTVVKFDADQTATFRVVATAKEGFEVTGISFTDRNGRVQKVDGNSASFTVRESGSISVHTKRAGAEDEDLSKGTVVAGATYLFYLSEGGDLYAWGENRYGVLGLPSSMAVVNTPTFVMSGVSKVVTSSANAYENGDTTFSTAILTTDGRLFTVGRNTCGQLGRNGQSDDTALGEIEFSGKVKDVSLGHDHLLIVDDKGTLWGIGSNSYGALGPTGVGGNLTKFTKIADNVKSASAGRRSTVYLTTDNRLWGLGDNRWKKLSQNHGDQIHNPVVIASNIQFVDSGEHQILTVDRNGKLCYAGWRTVQGFGQGSGNNPTFAPLMSGVMQADIYFGNAVILTVTGDAYVYGINTDNGIGSSVTNGTPKKVLSGVVDVAAGYGFTAYLTEDGRLLIQGSNAYGQAGNGTTGGGVNMVEAEF